MVKAYLRYDLADSWGVLTSGPGICFDRTGRLLVTAAVEGVLVWNLKQAVVIAKLVPPPPAPGRPAAEVTALAASPSADVVAAGYADGAVRLWALPAGGAGGGGGATGTAATAATPTCTFAGHRGAVAALRFSPGGDALASGGADGEAVVWDAVAEAGRLRLRGHTGPVTDAVFLGPRPPGAATHLATASKDGTLRVWDLEAQACAQVVAGHGGGEVWSVDAEPGGRRLATGAADAEVRLFRVLLGGGEEGGEGGGDAAAAGAGGGGDVLAPMGSVRRSGSERAAAVRFAAVPGVGTLLAAAGAGRVAEAWRLRDAAEAARRLRRRLKRRREKRRKLDGGGDAAAGGSDSDGDSDDAAPSAADELEPLPAARARAKIRGLALCPAPVRRGGAPAAARLVLALANNSLESWALSPGGSPPGAARAAALDGGGHRSDVRCVALAADDAAAVTAAADGARFWNPATGACLRAGAEGGGYGLAALFAPGGRHAVVGTKAGGLEVYDAGTGARVGGADAAHAGPVWALAPLPDGSGFASGSADKEVKFWEWDAVVDGGAAAPPRSLSVSHARTLRLSDDVLALRVSACGRLVAAALLDATVRVFFADSLKFFLSLYGHRLPALALDISSDSALLASGGADKNLRLWGLDYGDCRRSMFAHADSVTAVAFVPRTHYVFTGGRDGAVKYWDADRFELLLTLPAHVGPVWGLAVSSTGEFVLSAGADRSVRRWARTDEPFFVEEEREARLESLFEEDAAEGRAPATAAARGEAEGGAPAARATAEGLRGADALVAALDAAAAEEERLAEAAAGGGPPPPPNPLLGGAAPDAHVLAAVGAVRPAELEGALLVLPFADALRLLGYLAGWLRRGGGGRTELLARAATLLVRLHAAPLAASPAARPALSALAAALRARVQGLKDTAGFNAAAIAHLERQLRARTGAPAPLEAAAAALAPVRQRAEAGAAL